MMEVTFAQKFNAELNDTIESIIEKSWQLHKQENTFNGLKFRLASANIRPDKSIALNVGLTDYKTYLGGLKNIATLKEYGQLHHQDQGVFFSQKLGVSILLETTDACFVFIQRSKHVAAYAGQIDVPGGHPEPHKLNIQSAPIVPSNAMNNNIVHEIKNSILQEVHEEVNIPQDQISNLQTMGIIYQGQAATPSIAFHGQCNLSNLQVSQLYAKGPSDQFESTKILLLDLQQISTYDCTPCVRGILQIFKNQNYPQFVHIPE